MFRTITELQRYLFIYRAQRPAGDTCFFSVAVLANGMKQAEQIAINQVHQQGLHILSTDTATEAPWLDPQFDGQTLSELQLYGVAVKEMAA